jgi:D-alanine transaminase
MTKISYLNNQFLPHDQAFIHIEDRGFQLGDGVYEVILFRENKLVDNDWHLQRLFRSLDAIQLRFDKSEKELTEIILELFKKNNLQNGYVYLQITRGQSKRMQAFPEHYIPTLVMTVSSFTPLTLEELEKGFYAVTHEDIRWSRCNIKSVSLLGGSLMKQFAVEHNAAETILYRDGYITEASFSNVFIVDDKENLITRAADNFILKGITRDRIIKLAKENNINVIEKKFTLDELFNATEVFVSSSTLIIRPIVKIDHKEIGNNKAGKITKKLIELYSNFCV